MIQFTVPPPTLIPQITAPVPLVGTGTDQANNQMVCLQGDELPPAISGPLTYTSPPFVTPGTGTLQIILGPTNLTTMTTHANKPILIKGTPFQAMFQVSSPAMQPTPGGPVPDPLMVKPLTAQFVTTTMNLQAG